MIVSGRSIFQVLAPAVANAPVPVLPLLERPEEVLLRSLLELLPMPEELLARFAPEVLLPAVLAPLLLDELLPMPLVELELASLRGDELLEPVPVLEPLAPDAPEAPDSRTSDTFTSGAPWLAGNVTMATPNPFCTPLEDEPLRPLEVDELPLNPLPVELLELRSALEDEPIPLLLLRSVEEEEEEEPMPPLDDDEPESPPLEVPLVSERRLLLPRLLPLLLPLELLDELTGQLLNSAGLETSPCTMVSSLN